MGFEGEYMEHPNAAEPDAHLSRLLAPVDLEEPWFKSIVRGIRETLNPPKLPPLELTSKPVEDVNLGGMSQVEQPWFKSFISNIRDLINPPKLPPLEVTSKPVEVGTIWGAYEGHQGRWSAVSGLGYVALIALSLAIFQSKAVQNKVKDVTHLIYTPIGEYKPKLPPAKTQSGGGGGGGQKAPTPVSKGAAPKFAPKQFVMPELVHTETPKLPTPPTITAEAPKILANNYGDPLAKSDLLSGGQGVNGLGNGKGGGIGNGNGNGLGNGEGGGAGGGAYRIGGDVSASQIVSKIEPEYSEEARKAKYSGSVLLSIVVDEHGLPRDIKVIRPIGLGLDEKAVEAVAKWRFIPGRRHGMAVATQAQVEVNFRLL
jgi:periplasmic protein TonB